MGMIESIRNRQTLLLTIIGLGMLSFLVPYDAVIAMLGNNPGTQAAGSINGDDISFLEYRTRVQRKNSLFNYTTTKPLRTKFGVTSSLSASTATTSSPWPGA